MKKVYAIRTFNILNPVEYGYMKSPSGDKPTQVKLFKSRREARAFLKLMKKNLQSGWAHIIFPCYIKEGANND